MSITAIHSQGSLRRGILQSRKTELHSGGMIETANRLTKRSPIGLNSAHRSTSTSPAQYARTLNSMHQSSSQLVGCCR